MHLTIQGIQCHYKTSGEGADVLLLHGWGGEADSFLPLFNALKDSCRVTAIDFAGHGKSDRPPVEGWSVTEYMEWTAEFIRAAAIAPCDIVAHSFGGRVSILLCATYPDLVRKLVLTGSHGIVTKPVFRHGLRQGLSKILCIITRIFPSVQKIRSKLAGHFGSADYRALDDDMRRTFVKIVNQDLRKYLSHILSPTLLIWGSADTSTPLWIGQVMEREIPNAGLVVYQNCGHFAYLERSAEFCRTVRYFLLES